MIARKLAMTGAAAMLAACATTLEPGRQADTPEILRGCWIGRDGAQTSTLRLLPDRQNPGVLGGQVLTYRQGGGAPEIGVALGFEMDGSAAFMQPADRPMEQRTFRREAWVLQGRKGSQMSYVAYVSGEARLVADVTGGGGDETLAVNLVQAGAAQSRTLFMGRRDGCD